METKPFTKWCLGIALAVIASSVNTMAQETWIEKGYSPVANPLFFEEPTIQSDIRPIFMHHRIDNKFLAGPGYVNVYAAQIRWAVNERLAIIATKDGYIDAHFDKVPALSHQGWADLAAGVKYALILDKEHDFILTPGLKIELPTGNKKVFQGNGKGEWDIFLSSSKGFGAVRVMGSAGVRAPNDMDAETAQAHYSLQLDYEVSRYFVPFVTINAFTVLNNGKGALPLNSEGFDLINFGSPNAKGQTQAAVGGGFRSRVVKWGDLGFAYEHGIGGPRGLYDDRFTVDFVIRF